MRDKPLAHVAQAVLPPPIGQTNHDKSHVGRRGEESIESGLDEYRLGMNAESSLDGEGNPC